VDREVIADGFPDGDQGVADGDFAGYSPADPA